MEYCRSEAEKSVPYRVFGESRMDGRGTCCLSKGAAHIPVRGPMTWSGWPCGEAAGPVWGEQGEETDFYSTVPWSISKDLARALHGILLLGGRTYWQLRKLPAIHSDYIQYCTVLYLALSRGKNI